MSSKPIWIQKDLSGNLVQILAGTTDDSHLHCSLCEIFEVRKAREILCLDKVVKMHLEDAFQSFYPSLRTKNHSASISNRVYSAGCSRVRCQLSTGL
jgi:hypothetical protein